MTSKDLVEFSAAAIPKKSSSIFDMGALLSAVKSAVRNEKRRGVRRGERERERKEWARRDIAMVRQKRERERVLWSHRRGYPVSSSSASAKNPFRTRTMVLPRRFLGRGSRLFFGPGGFALHDAFATLARPSRRFWRKRRHPGPGLGLPFAVERSFLHPAAMGGVFFPDDDIRFLSSFPD